MVTYLKCSQVVLKVPKQQLHARASHCGGAGRPCILCRGTPNIPVIFHDNALGEISAPIALTRGHPTDLPARRRRHPRAVEKARRA